MKLEELCIIVNRAQTIRKLLPKTDNPDEIYSRLMDMRREDFGLLFHSIDQLLTNVYIMSRKDVEFTDREKI